MKKLTTISVDNLKLRTIIGFNDWEREKKQDVSISFSFKYDIQKALENDSKYDIVDYKKIVKHIIKMAETSSYNLLETLSESVYEYLHSNIQIEDIVLSTSKPGALRFTDNVSVTISQKERKNLFIIGIGSNIDAKKNVKKAKKELIKLGEVIKETNIIKTKPLKFKQQNDFLNGAIMIQSDKSFSDMNSKLKEIETSLGRVRNSNKNGPRTIDLDILTYNNAITDKDVNSVDFIKDFVNELNS